MFKSSKISGSSGTGSIRHYDKSNGRFNFGTRLIDEEEFKQGHSQIYSDDSKFARQLKKLLRDEDEEEKLKKLADLSSYLDHHENIKFVLKLGRQSLNILIKLLLDQHLDENKKLIVECISKIGSIMMMTDRDPNKYLEWALEIVSVDLDENSKESIKDNCIKCLVMDALYQSFESDMMSRYTRDNINFILMELKKLLETVDNPNLVMKISKIILLLAKSYSYAFNHIFHDVVDILIAWHIDHNQPDEVIQFTSNSLVELRSNWLNDLNFTFNLLEQFVEDVESYLNAYFQDTNKLHELEHIEKISALFKVYCTVIRSISCIDDSYHKSLKNYISHNEYNIMCSTFHRLLNSVLKVYDSSYSELLLTPINQIIALFGDIFDDKLDMIVNQPLIDYIIKLNFNKESWYDHLDLSYLNFIQKIIKHFIATNNIDIITQILSYDGRIWNYRFSSNNQIVQECLIIYKNLILVKVIPVIQEVYKNILYDTDASFSTILKYSNCNDILSMIREDERNFSEYGLKMLNSVKNAESCLLFNLTVFAELGNVKNNLILMYALTPSLFQILTERLSPLNWSLAETFPHIQYAIINRLYNHCLRHENFIVTSSLFVHKYGNDSPTKDYFRIIVENVTKLLAHPSTNIDICILLLKWSIKFIETITVENGTIFSSNLFINFLNAIITISYTNEEEISLLSSEIFITFITKFEKINETCLRRIFDLCKYFLMSPHKNLRSNYMKLMTMIPLNISLNSRMDLKTLTMLDFSNFSSISRHNYILSSSDCAISLENFKTLMSFVLAGIQQSDNEEFEKSCIERIYYSCRRNLNEIKDQGRDSVTFDSIIENHDGILWFWALWECAQFCVQSRLKTPLGKAQDTFVAIEAVLKNFSNYESQNQSIDKSKNIFIDLNRINLLEHFVELLERIIYNAYEGIASGQLSVQKVVKVFFRTNKSTCNEWFSRVRFYLSNLCVKSGNYELGIRQCWEFLNYCILQNNTSINEFDIILNLLVKCYIKLGSWQQLIGLYDWLKKKLKKNGIDWIKYAADDAKGCLESASLGYKEIIQKNLDDFKKDKENHSNVQSNLIKFQAERLFDCFLQLNDWNEYILWYNDYESSYIKILENESYVEQIEKYIDIDHIKALSSFKEGDFEAASNLLGPYPSFENFTSSIECKWNFEEIERTTLKNIQQSIIIKRLSSDSESSYLNELNDQILKILNIDEISYSSHQKLILILLINNVLEQKAKNGFSLSKSDDFNLSQHSLKYLNTLLLMSKNYEFNFDLNLACAKLARKQNNNNLSMRLLEQQNEHFRTSLNLYPEECPSNFHDSLSKLMTDIQNLSDHQLKLSIVEFLSESSKLLAKKNCFHESIDVLTKSVLNFVSFNPIESLIPASFTPGVPFIATNTNNKFLKESLNQKCSELLMNFSKLLNRNPDILKNFSQGFYDIDSQDLLQQIGSNLNKILSLKYSDMSRFNLKNEAYSNNESIIGNILDLASVLAPNYAKTWFALGNWCYKWGKKYADLVQMSVDLSKDDIIKDSDVSQLLDLLPVHCSDEEKKFVLGLYSNCLSLNHIGEENLQNPMFQFNSEIFRSQAEVQLVENCKTLSQEHIETIISYLMNIIDRVLYYLKIACKSYFMFLKLKSSDEKNISSSLRIIKLLVKYAIELKDDLKMGLDETPSEPWKNIIPQLFSRLNHPEMYVRESVSQLLCRIAKDFPHLIIYPAVVGSQDGPTRIETVHKAKNDNSLFENLPRSQQEDLKIDSKIEIENYSDVSDEDNSAELSDELEQAVEEEEEENETNTYDEYIQDESKSELKNTYKYLLNTLNDSNRSMIDQVKLFVHEMRRITLLREELWYGTLNQIYSDFNKRVEQLNLEITKTNSNPHLTEEEKPKILKQKYHILLQPIVIILEHVQEITTNLPPETPNEEIFQLEFEDKINEVINQLKDNENFNKPSNSLTLFKQLFNTFHHRSQRRQSTSLQMDQISPKLYQLKSTNIPIPGKDGNSIFIYSIANAVQVLPTKTKPKKLFFIGSNGRRYPYLFKGLEDLHLDERIMQLLNIINSMFSKLNKTETVHFHALNYSVTPLGPRSGLISWVEGATPLFNLYKKWQHREAVYLASKAQNQTSQHVHLMRPNDIFYAKLNPLLKEKGIKNFQENRSECPVPVLRKVLEDLIKETPNDLLSKEIWCNSTTPANWWTSVQIFCRSTAVMSMIGYVIGLGDRHLDNVLINLRTGQVVHIDYNICFEKGYNLRVPEKVPFRMTQNIQNALGLTGCEGLFKLSSQQVLNILRQKRETLLTLLEAFVYDPLLDWTGHDTGIIASFYGGGNAKLKSDNAENKKETRKNLEKKQSWELFEIRLLENGTLMSQNQQQLEKFICQNLEKIKALSDLSKRKGLNDNLIRLNEQAKIYLDESLTLHETMKNKTTHPVYTLRDRYTIYEKFNSNLDMVKSNIANQLEKLEKLAQQHLTSFDFFRRKKIEFEFSKIERPQEMVNDFLKSIGQSTLVELSDKIFNDIIRQENKLKQSIDSLSNVASSIAKILDFFSIEFLSRQGKNCKFARWLKQLKNSLTKEDFEKIKKESTKEYLENFDCEIIFQKIDEIKSSLSPIENHLQALKLRKANILELNEIGHEEIFFFISENLNEFTDSQLFESFNSCLLQFFGENLQKWMAMETAAIDAKENLIHVTSMDGDWYLEEMLTLIQYCAHLKDVVSSVYTHFNKFPPDDLNEINFKRSLDIFVSLESLFQILNNLIIEFGSVLLPKLLKVCFNDEKELDMLINEFNSMHLEEFFEILSIQNSNDVLNEDYVQKIGDIKSRYGKLLTAKNGKMGCQILLEFEKMFSKVDIEFDKAIKFCKNLYSSPESITQNLFLFTPNLVYLMDPSNLMFMKNLFLVKKIQTIYSCIENCAEFKKYCFGSKIEFNFHQEDIFYSLKNYVSEFVTQMVNGIPTILIGNMVTVLGNDQYNLINLDPVNQTEHINFLINQKLMINQINNYYLSNFNQLMLNLDTNWVNLDLKRRIDSNVRFNEEFLNLIQDVIVSMEWLYDPFLVDSQTNNLSAKTFRESLLENLSSISNDISIKINTLTKNLSELYQNEANILRRLEWSSSTNPSLAELGKKFKQTIQFNEDSFSKKINDVEKFLDNIKSWINFEQIRSFKSKLSLELKTDFDNVLKLIEDNEILDRSNIPPITEAELNLINFKSFKDHKLLNGTILQEYYRLLYDEVAQMKRIKQKEEKDLMSKIDELNKSLLDLKSILNQHSKIMTDIKPILKSMTKFGENQRLSDYSKTYQNFSETCQQLIRILGNKDLIETETSELEETFKQLCEFVPKIYEDLKTLNDPCEKKSEVNKNERKNVDTVKVLRGIQEGNSHAIAVWKRVHEKLDGRDPDNKNQITVQEQVDYLIEEATNLNNLAVLYEGWTPWV